MLKLSDAERGFGKGAGLGDRHRAAARLADFAEGALRALACELRGLVAKAREGVWVAPYLNQRAPTKIVFDELPAKREARQYVAVGANADHMSSSGASAPSLADETQFRRHGEIAEVVHNHQLEAPVVVVEPVRRLLRKPLVLLAVHQQVIGETLAALVRHLHLPAHSCPMRWFGTATQHLVAVRRP